MEKWWKDIVFYEIYMPSFCDGNSDGIGDFKGIISKLDYLQELGIKGIWLTPFYPSPKIDNGYDIADYYAVDPDYGTLEDFEKFIDEAHKRDIRVIADLVLNHTSTQHPWFKASRASKDNPKRDWYIWKDEIPNNWESFFGGSAWEFDEQTDSYYYHAFAKEQVDLNWANPEVKDAMFEVMKFWIDKGIDGFRLDVINFLSIRDENRNNPFDEEKGEQIHLYDKDQEGIINIVKEIATFAHGCGDLFLVGEVGSENLDLLKQYCGDQLLDVVFNFNLGSMASWNPDQKVAELKKMDEVYDASQIPTLFFSSHDMPRHISRFGEAESELARAQLIATLMLTAKGVPFLYYGDEIGMRDLYASHISMLNDVQGRIAYDLEKIEGLSDEEALVVANEKSRDKSRSPMQWDHTEFSGFSTIKPWLPIPECYSSIQVLDQQQDPTSLYHYYRKLITLRTSENVLKYGDYRIIDKDRNLLTFIREDEKTSIIVILNVENTEQEITVPAEFKEIMLSNKRGLGKIDQPVLLILPHEALILKGLKK